jgi:hypothetical protein
MGRRVLAAVPDKERLQCLFRRLLNPEEGLTIHDRGGAEKRLCGGKVLGGIP